MRTVRAALAAILILTTGLITGCSAGSPPGATVPVATATPGETTLAPPATATTEPPTATQPPSTTTKPPTKTSTTKPPTTTKPPATPPPGIPAHFAGQDLTKIPTSKKVVALTFDAGANANSVPSILATLSSKNVVATFFLTGNFVRDFPGPSQQIVAAGHRVGNHTVNHPYMTQLTNAQVRDQVRNAETSIRSVTGASAKPLFRFPYGDRDARVIGVVNELGYVPIRWTVDSLGWQGTEGGTRDASFVRDRVLNGAAVPGGIVLFHVGSANDGSTLDADALPEIIDRFRARGFDFVTLDVLFS